MSTDDVIEIEGTITSVLPNTMFRVELEGTKHIVLAHISGKIRKRFIRMTVGDRVKMEMSPKDVTQARIVYRLDSRPPLPPGAHRPKPGGYRGGGNRRR